MSEGLGYSCDACGVNEATHYVVKMRGRTALYRKIVCDDCHVPGTKPDKKFTDLWVSNRPKAPDPEPAAADPENEPEEGADEVP